MSVVRAPVVPRSVLDEVREHATYSPRQFRESVGMVVVETDPLRDVAASYVRLRNWALRDFRFRAKGREIRGVLGSLQPGTTAYLVHSHPNGFRQPSDGDLRNANREWLGRPYGIYMVPTDELLWFVLTDGRARRHARAPRDYRPIW